MLMVVFTITQELIIMVNALSTFSYYSQMFGIIPPVSCMSSWCNV